MWPEQQQPGGQPDPRDGNPQGPPPPPGSPHPGGQQPGFGQPGTFGPPPGSGQSPSSGQPSGFGQPQYGPPPTYPSQGYGYPQQPPQQPGFGQVPPQWQPPGPPTIPPQPPTRRRGVTIGVAIAVAVVVVAAGVGIAMGLRGGDTTTTAASGTPSASASATPSASAPSGPQEAGPRGDGSNVQPVVPGWQVVVRADRKVAFDVPQGWAVKKQDEIIGFEDEKGNPAVGMGGPAIYKENYCGDTYAGAAGTKGAQGAKSVQDAAENQAQAWVYYGFNDMKSKQKGTLKSTPATPFSNSHGIKGYAASATETNVPKTTKCATDGAAYAIAWVGHDSQLTVFVLYTNTGVPEEIPSQTIATIEGSIRPIP
ncbi:hypothetical protein ACWGCW_29420 [Streptomyces sp. NPDC054933]